jgi:hypothetical protein
VARGSVLALTAAMKALAISDQNDAASLDQLLQVALESPTREASLVKPEFLVAPAAGMGRVGIRAGGGRGSGYGTHFMSASVKGPDTPSGSSRMRSQTLMAAS